MLAGSPGKRASLSSGGCGIDKRIGYLEWATSKAALREAASMSLASRAGVCLALVLVGVLAVSAFYDPHAPWLPQAIRPKKDRKCAEFVEEKIRKWGISDTSGESNVFYSARLETCVQSRTSSIRNDFHIADFSRDFLRPSIDEPDGVGPIFGCSPDGANNVLLDKVEAHHGYVWHVAYDEWMDDGNGGPPATVRMPAKKFGREDCEKLFRRKLKEIE